VMDGLVMTRKSTYIVLIGWMGACDIKPNGGVGVPGGLMALTFVVHGLAATVAKAPFFETADWAASSAIAELPEIYFT